ncbi:unnamed protein product [Haemonchus placei]|uniref:Uncharacterized protein n=1 Tax=Haemonchus placei TaxID=6290 RepID=A0A0N4W9U3_HAEPC|nr:unnamed protein product [Haemonchus placei]
MTTPALKTDQGSINDATAEGMVTHAANLPTPLSDPMRQKAHRFKNTPTDAVIMDNLTFKKVSTLMKGNRQDALKNRELKGISLAASKRNFASVTTSNEQLTQYLQ